MNSTQTADVVLQNISYVDAVLRMLCAMFIGIVVGAEVGFVLGAVVGMVLTCLMQVKR